MGFDIKGTFPFIRSNKEDLFSPVTTFVFFVVRTTRTSLQTKERSSSHHSSCQTYNPSRAGCICYLRLCREERGPVGGCGGAVMRGADGRRSSWSRKNTKRGGGMFTFGGLRPKVLFDVVWKRLKTGIKNFIKGFINGNLNHVAISRYSTLKTAKRGTTHANKA